MNALNSVGTLQVGGLPLHPLIVHAVVILVPLTALAIILGTLWPAARRRLGIVTPLAALLVVILVPITVAAGQSLEAVVGQHKPGVAEHAALGGMLLPWAIAMLVASAAQWAWYRWGMPKTSPEHARRTSVITIAIGAVAIIASIGAFVMVILIGEAGARAVWGGLA